MENKFRFVALTFLLMVGFVIMIFGMGLITEGHSMNQMSEKWTDSQCRMGGQYGAEQKCDGSNPYTGGTGTILIGFVVAFGGASAIQYATN